MQPTILKIEQVTTSDETGQPVPAKQVMWMLGDDGPFYHTCADVDFDADHIVGIIKADAERMTRLRNAFA